MLKLFLALAYGFVDGGCKLNEGCGVGKGMMCGSFEGSAINNGKTYDQCYKRAVNEKADGFAYKWSHSGSCRMCTKSQIDNPQRPARNWGIYAKKGKLAFRNSHLTSY